MGRDVQGSIATRAVEVHGQKVGGFAGEKFRILIEKHGLTALSTIDKFQPTYFRRPGKALAQGLSTAS